MDKHRAVEPKGPLDPPRPPAAAKELRVQSGRGQQLGAAAGGGRRPSPSHRGQGWEEGVGWGGRQGFEISKVVITTGR